MGALDELMANYRGPQNQDALESMMALRQSVQPMTDQIMAERQKGVFERMREAITPDTSLGGALQKMMMAIPGGRPTIMSRMPMAGRNAAFQPNNYAEPPVAANAIKPFEHERFRSQLESLLPITPEKEAQAEMLRSRMRQVDAMPHDNVLWERPQPRERSTPPRPNPLTTDLDEIYGAISPQERARLLGIKLVDD